MFLCASGKKTNIPVCLIKNFRVKNLFTVEIILINVYKFC